MLLALLCAGCAHNPGIVFAPGALAYRVELTGGGGELDVALTRVQAGPTVFTFGAPSAVGTIDAVTLKGQRVEVSPQSNGDVELPLDWASLHYRYVVADAQRQFGGDLAWGRVENGELLVSGNAYLLRPKAGHPELDATIEIAGAQAALPWLPNEDGKWTVPSMLLLDAGFHVFGGRRCFVSAGEGKIEVALIGTTVNAGGLNDDQLCSWIRSSAAEVLSLRPDFPSGRVLVGLVGAPSNEASPFGELEHSTPASLAFLVGREAKPEDFATDAMAPSRFVALATPRFDPPAPWLSSGLHAYLLALARGRSKQIPVAQAWHELWEGVELGALEGEGFRGDELMRQNAGGRSRAVEAYGVLVALGVDVALRKTTHGAKSLDQVVAGLGTVPISLHDFAQAVDAAAGQPIFDAELRKHQVAMSLRDRHDLFSALGLSWHSDEVTFTPGPDATIRDAILPPR